MASIKNLKKDIHNVLGDIIEECYAWELMNTDKDTKKSQKIIDEVIEEFDSLIEQIHVPSGDNSKAHFTKIKNRLESSATKFLEKANKL